MTKDKFLYLRPKESRDGAMRRKRNLKISPFSPDCEIKVAFRGNSRHRVISAPVFQGE